MIQDAFNPNFGLPDMGDYYYDAPDQEIMFGELNKLINSVHRGKQSDAAAYKFYAEEPPGPGFNKANKTYTFDINLSKTGISDSDETVSGLSVSDGDTISIPMDRINQSDGASGAYLDAIRAYAASHGKDGNDTLTLRFAGLDAKELPHFRKVSLENFDGASGERKTMKLADALKDNDCIASKYKSWMQVRKQLEDGVTYSGNKVDGTYFTYNEPEDSNAVINTIKLEDGKYHEYFTVGDGYAYVIQKCDSNDYDAATIADAGVARDVVCNALDQADMMRIVVDGTQISRDGKKYTTEFGSDPYNYTLLNKFKQAMDSAFDSSTVYSTPGFNIWGQDAYGRCIAAIYVRINGKWINLNKMVIASTDKTEVNKYNAGGDGSSGVDTSDYDFDDKEYADSIYADSKKFDDRQKVQTDLFARIGKTQTWEQLKDWTVTIGDVTLFVPPTSIRCITQTKADRMPLVRAKGAMAKSSTKAQRIIEMDLFFNEDRGINGFEYQTNTRPDNKGKAITYWMNGLRALYAQFRVAPFLPIDNTYVNEILGIDAVTMVNFACETVPSFPRLLKATIQMAEFEYRIYMPEIPTDDGDDNQSDDDDNNDTEIRNYFAEQINYPLFRYYYQRLLRNGEALKNTKFMDPKYIVSTFGNRTCLVPAKFQDPYIRFYIPNRDQLIQLKKAKIQRLTRPNVPRSLTKNELDFCGEIAKIKNELDYLGTNGALLELNSFLNDPDKKNCILTVDQTNQPVILDPNSTDFSAQDTAEITQQFKDLMDSVGDAYDTGITSLKKEDGSPLCQKAGTRTWSVYKGAGDDTGYSLNYCITWNIDAQNISENQLNEIKTQFSTSGTTSSALFKDHQLTIQLSIPMSDTYYKEATDDEKVMAASGATTTNSYGSNVRKIDLGNEGETYVQLGSNPDYQFIEFCNGVAQKQGVGGTQDANKAKQNSDFVTPGSLEFVPYNDDHDFLVEAIHMSTSNSFSQITIQETTGYAPQYMGGTDITIQLSMYTKDKQCAAAMNLLPTLSAEYARQFRLVLKEWPLKIDTEFTKLFGITDVMVESVSIDTVPNQPGLYHINMTLVSVDRTLRNRESLQKKDLENFHNLSIAGVAAERKWTYDKMAEFLSTAELYPDLELPTLSELDQQGFSFIHYSNKQRIYPDPDFYFTYSYVLMSQIIRESVLKALDSQAAETNIGDRKNNSATGGITGSWNTKFVRDATWQKDLDTEFPDEKDYLAANILSDYMDTDDPERNELWTVAKNIKVALMEKKMSNFVNDSVKQGYKQSAGKASYSNSSSTYDNDTSITRINTTGEATPVTGPQTTDSNTNSNGASASNGASNQDVSAGNASSNGGSDSGQQTTGTATPAGQTTTTTTNTNSSAANQTKKKEYTTTVDSKTGKITSLNDPEPNADGVVETDATSVSQEATNQLKANQNAAKLKNYTKGSGKYNIKAHERCNNLIAKTEGIIDDLLNQEIKDTDSKALLNSISTVLSELNTQTTKYSLSTTVNAESTEEADKAAKEKLNNMSTAEIISASLTANVKNIQDVMAKYSGSTDLNITKHDVETFLAAAADAICSNNGVDYSAKFSGGQAAKTLAEDAAAGAAGGAATGAVIGSVIPVGGTAAGAIAGTVIGTAGGAIKGAYEDLASDGAVDKSATAPWKYCNKYRAVVGANGVLQTLSFTKNDKDCDKLLAYAQYNAVEFGYFNFRYYLPEELEDRFGDYGKINPPANTTTIASSSGSSSTDNSSSENASSDTDASNSDSSENSSKDTASTASTSAYYGKEAVSRYGGYLADPFYRHANIDKQAEYVYNCMTNFEYARAAFLRICLLYLKVLIDYDVFPSFAYDVMRDALDNEQRIKDVISRMEAMKKKKAADDTAKSEAQKKQGTGGGKWAKKNNKDTKANNNAAQNGGEVGSAIPEAESADGSKKEENSSSDSSSSDSSSTNKADASKISTTTDPDKVETKKTEDGQPADKNGNAVDSESKAAGKDTLTDKEDKAATASNSVADITVQRYKKLFDENKKAIDRGKLFTIIALGVTDGDQDFLKALMNRDYDKLNAISSASKNGQTIKDNDTQIQYPTKIRSFIRALRGEGAIDENDIGSTEEETPFSELNQYNARKNIAAASMDPKLYLVHSFYDMVVHDCRGRMLRAFPTFYMFMLDEGRTIGKWKLHDNFYNINAITEITIAKSRKIPTDTATVTMTNFYDTYTTDDEDLNMNYTTSFSDVFDSLFLPNQEAYAEREEERSRNAPSVERIHIRPGARIHIRLGYGADASHLPISFNGTVAEVSTEDVVKLVCQSDGAEICKPILLEKDASQAQGQDEFTGFSDWCENGDTPKHILRSLLCLKGGFWNSKMHEMGWDEFAKLWGDPPNPLGIYHFGNPDRTYAGDKEPVQNIFEIGLTSGDDRYLGSADTGKGNSTQSVATVGGAAAGAVIGSIVPGLGTLVGGAIGGAIAGGSIANLLTDSTTKDNAPKINFDLFGKSVWDIVNICRSCDPEYYAAVRPFHLRSTLFMGRGQDYYAYDYENAAGSWIERRKPFQQAHLYTSVTDIIANGIAVSTKDIKTCAVGIYESQGFMNAKVPQKTEPQWVDSSIYPEYQKMMTVDTKLYGAASRKLGKISDIANFFGSGITNNFMDRAFDNEGDARSHNRMAVKMTISGLKDGMKEMYQGQMTIIGDPSVEPQDRMLINDTYNGITGECLIRDVVQVFSADQGYRTVLTPDLITTQLGKPAEGEMKRSMYGNIIQAVTSAAIAASCVYAMNKSYTKAMDEYKKFKASNIAQKATQAVKNTGSHLPSGGKITTAIGKVSTEAGKAIGLAKSGFGKLFSAGEKVLGGVKAAKFNIAFMFVSAGLGSLEDLFAEKVNARKRLLVFPLQKYNRPMVGGIDGNVGIVYGSPNFGKKDGFQDILSNLAKHLPNSWFDTFFDQDTGLIPISNQVYFDEQKALANNEAQTTLIMDKVNRSNATNNFTKALYNPIQTRIEVRDKAAREKAVKRLGISGKTADEINEDPNLAKMQAIFTDRNLKSFIDCGFFRVAAVDKGFTSDLSDKVQCIYLRDPAKNNDYVPVNAILDGNGCYDIPYLSKNASGVIDEIVKQSFNLMAGTEQQRDPYKWYQDNSGSFLTVTSALKCGSTKGYENTGYSCVITCSDEKSKTALNSAVDSINSQQAEMHQNMSDAPSYLVDKKVDGNDVYLLVRPPEGSSKS